MSQGENNLQDILASIKKVIAEDRQMPGRAGRGVIAARDREPGRDNDGHVLELTDTLDPADTASNTNSEGSAQAMSDHQGRDEAANSLVSPECESELRASLEALATLSKPGMPPQIVRSGETSLEGLVREMLRPMLAEWLEQNLPALVEEMVAREISRIRGKPGQD